MVNKKIIKESLGDEWSWVKGSYRMRLTEYMDIKNTPHPTERDEWVDVYRLFGLKVYLREDSKYVNPDFEYYNPLNVLGEIIDEQTYDYQLPIQVMWENGTKNSYHPRDLDVFIDDRLNESTENDLQWIEDIEPHQTYKIVNDMSMYISGWVLDNLNLDNQIRFNRKEYDLGVYRWAHGGFNYRFTAKARELKKDVFGSSDWHQVMGLSGDSGFGYSFITKRNTIGKRGRKQIFKQIIDRLGLDSF